MKQELEAILKKFFEDKNYMVKQLNLKYLEEDPIIHGILTVNIEAYHNDPVIHDQEHQRDNQDQTNT